MAKRITIIKVRRDSEKNINQDLQWMGNSLGLFNLRDKDSSCFRIFITLVRKSRNEQAISSDDIAERLNLARGTVVHHLTKLMNSGIVIKEKRGYLLRENSMEKLIKDIQRDTKALFDDIEEVAKEIDQRMGQ
jgi:predicted transcriptional regulator